MSKELQETDNTLRKIQEILKSYMTLAQGIDVDQWTESAIESMQYDVELWAYTKALAVIGEDIEHKHLERVYDDGCKKRDAVNKVKATQRIALAKEFNITEDK